MALTQAQIDALNGKNDLTPDQSATALGHSNGLLGNLIGGYESAVGGLQQFTTGMGKQELGTLQNIGKPITDVVGAGVSKLTGQPAPQTGLPQQALQPQGTGEQLGSGAASIGEFMAPSGLVREAEAGIQGIQALPTIAKVAGQALTEAGVGGAVGLAQTGSPSQALTDALTFGVTKGITGSLGAAAKAIGLPEHLYSTVFKTASTDMLNELKSGGIITLQKQNPTLFNQFVEQGIIKTSADGTFQVDETLAKQALDRGLKGSIQNMANIVVKNTLQNESDARSIAANATRLLTIPSPDKLGNILKTIAADYENVGQGEISNKASTLAQQLEQTGGKIDAQIGLTLRRFLDGMRSRASYNPQVKLSTTGENFKYWSNTVRRELNKIPGMSSVMKDYSFNIDALTSLAKTAATRGNQQLVNMLDVLVFEGGLTEGTPGLGAGLSLFRKYIGTPGAATNIGSAIQKSGLPSKLGMAAKGFLSSIGNFFTGGDENQAPQE